MNEEQLAQLRAEVTSGASEGSLSGIDSEEDFQVSPDLGESSASGASESSLSGIDSEEDLQVSPHSGESSASGNEQLAQLRDAMSSNASESDPINHQPRQGNGIRFCIGGSYDSNSSDDTTKLSFLERGRLSSPGPAGSNEWQSPLLQPRNLVPLDPMQPQAAAGSESDTESHTQRNLGKHRRQTSSADFLVSSAMEIGSDGHGYSSDGLGNLREVCSPATQRSISVGGEFGSETHETTKSIPPPYISSESEDKDPMPRPPALTLRQEQPVDDIHELSTSSVGTPIAEGAENRVLLQSMADRDAGRHLGSHGTGEFDYHRKLAPLATQELRSFVFHDLTVSHNIPRVARQGFRSLHTAGRPSDPRTTRKRMRDITGVEEVRYDCCIEGCISYALPRYSNLTECPFSGCKHARYKADGGPYTQHSYIPITHRLRLMYSDKERAIEMMAYRAKMDEEMRTEVWRASAHT